MRNLTNILFVNGISTTVAGIALLATAQGIATLFGFENTGYFIGVGLFFTVFGIYVFLQSVGKKQISRSSLRFITTIDWLWVLLSTVLIITLHRTISTIGLTIIVAIGLWVALMAFLEGKHLTNNPNT